MEVKDLGVLGFLLNKNHDEIKSAVLKEDGEFIENLEDELRTLHESNLDSYRTERKTVFDNGYKKAQKDVLEKKEDELRSKFDVSGETIDEIVQGIYDNGKKEAKVNPSDVKNSEIYLNDIKKFQGKVSELESELLKERSERKYDRTSSVLDSFIPNALASAKKVLPEDSRNDHLELLKTHMREKGVYWEINEDGQPMPIDEDGNRIRNDKTLKDFSAQEIIEKYSFFLPTAKNSGAQSPGNSNESPDGGNNKYDYSSVKNVNDFNAELEKIKDVTEADERTSRSEALFEVGESLGL